MRIALFGGSFNPVHVGHIMLASYVAQFCGFDEVWLTLSPLNPLKAGSDELLPDDCRLAMLRAAVGSLPGMRVCDIELSMPRPNYTIDTLERLSQLYPDDSFTPLVGSDNWAIFRRWRRSEEILSRFGVAVYPRPGYDIDRGDLPDGVTILDGVPVVELSSTFIRRSIAAGHDMRAFLPPGAADYIAAHKLYRH